MREEVLILRGKPRAADKRRDLGVGGDLTIFRGHLGERPDVGIVYVPDVGKLEPAECLYIGQVN